MEWLLPALNVLGVLGNLWLFVQLQRQRRRGRRREAEMLRSVCFVAAIVESPRIFPPPLRHMAHAVLPSWVRAFVSTTPPSQAVH